MEKSYMSMEQKVCVICGKVHDSGALILDTRLKATLDRNTITGYDHCDACKSKLDESYIAFVEVTNGNENTRMKSEDANRTGKIVWLKKHIAAKIFNVDIKEPMVFVQSDVTAYFESLMPKS